MSSILDALNKLEQDKAKAQRKAEGYEDDPVSAAQELVGRSVLHDRVTLRFAPLTLVIGGMIGAIVLASISIGLAFMIFRTSGEGEASAAVAAAQPTPSVTEQVALIEEPTASITQDEPTVSTPLEQPAEATNQTVESVPAEDEPDAATTPLTHDTPSQDSTLEPTPEIANQDTEPEEKPEISVASKTEPAPVERPSPPPVIEEEVAPAELPQRDRVAQAPRTETRDRPRLEVPADIAEEDDVPSATALHLLPELTPAIASRYTDEPLTLNMVIPASSTTPYGFALINRVKVYEGQRISGTNLQLFEVKQEGVGVRVTGSGERYFIPF